MFRLSRKFQLRTCLEPSFWFRWKWDLSALIIGTRLDCSVIFFTVLMYFCTVSEFFSSCFGYWSATVVTDNHPLIIVYIDTVSPVREQFFRLAQKSIGILQYLLSNPLLSICLPFEHLLKSLYLQYLFFVYFFWDSNRSLRTFAVIIEYSFHSSINCSSSTVSYVNVKVNIASGPDISTNWICLLLGKECCIK